MTTALRTEPVVRPRDTVAATYVDASLARLLTVVVDALDPLEVWLFGSRAEPPRAELNEKVAAIRAHVATLRRKP